MDKLNLTPKRHQLLKHVHMPAADRAKIYLPFDALPGLREALAEVQEEFAEYGQTEKEVLFLHYAEQQIHDINCGAGYNGRQEKI